MQSDSTQQNYGEPDNFMKIHRKFTILWMIKNISNNLYVK